MTFSRDLKAKAAEIWEAGYQHPFVQKLGQGTLEMESFQFYLIQDYHYLIEYAKVCALGAVKSDCEELLARFTEIQYGILSDEMSLHRRYIADFGIPEEKIHKAKPSLFNRTYTANMLAIGHTQGLAEILATIFPCAWTYYDYACRLKKDYPEEFKDNIYRSWIENYSSDDFFASFEWFYDEIDRLVATKNLEEKRMIEEIFISSVEFEYLFWDMSYKKEMSIIQ